MTPGRRKELEQLVVRLRRAIFNSQDDTYTERVGVVLRKVRTRLEEIEQPERERRDTLLLELRTRRSAYRRSVDVALLRCREDEKEEHSLVALYEDACGSWSRAQRLADIRAHVGSNVDKLCAWAQDNDYTPDAVAALLAFR